MSYIIELISFRRAPKDPEKAHEKIKNLYYPKNSLLDLSGIKEIWVSKEFYPKLTEYASQELPEKSFYSNEEGVLKTKNNHSIFPFLED